jgi:phosphate transport system substrate-binding protein
LLGLILTLAGVGAPCPVRAEQATVRIGGNGSALGALRLLAAAYHREHPAVTVTVVPNLGSSGAILALRNGALDLAVTARPLRSDEHKGDLKVTEYASSPFAFIAHHTVAKNDLTQFELTSLLHQDAPLWPDGSRMRLVLRPEGDADCALVRQISPEVERALQRAQARPGMVLAVTDSDCLRTVSSMPGALGAMALTMLVTEKHQVHPLSFNGVAPTLKNLAAGSYPLAKRFYLVSQPRTSAAARAFANYLRTPKGRELLKKAGNLTPPDGKEG